MLLPLLALAPTVWMLGPFTRLDAINPVLKPDPVASFMCPMRQTAVHWEHDNVFNPAEARYKGRLVLLFRAEDDNGQGIGGHTSRIGFAETSDLIHFSRRPAPVLYPGNDDQKPYDWPGGCEDPRVVHGPHGYVMTYTAWNRKVPTLSVATSTDLVHWKKQGPAFAKAGERWLKFGTKSAAIVVSATRDQMEATQIKGKYWMFWGDSNVNLATSDNLTDWTPVTDPSGNLIPVLRPRRGHFDSDLCESGPPAVLTKNGIVLLYNGKNSLKWGDPNLSPNVYAAGQALFDASDPTKLLGRTESPFFRPERPYEVTGQYIGGTVFIEGLVPFKNQWVLAYGTADSMVALATSPR